MYPWPENSVDFAGVRGSDLAEAAAVFPCICELPSPAASWYFFSVITAPMEATAGGGSDPSLTPLLGVRLLEPTCP